jgi:hypothetical protein
MEPMQSKPVWQSKLFWLNIVATLAALLEAFKVFSLPAEYLAIGASVVAVANIVIRVWFTDQPLTLK